MGGHVLKSRLGRKIVYRFLLVGLYPLLLFSGYLYWQTQTLLKTSAHQTLLGYSQLAKEKIFSTLDGSRSRLERYALHADDPSRPDAIKPFRRIVRLTPSTDTAFFARLDATRREFLRRGRTILTPTYPLDDAFTASLVMELPDGSFLAGELDPAELWDVTRAAFYGSQCILVVLDDSGRVLASSNESIVPGSRIFSSIPNASQIIGDSGLADMPNYLWGFSDLWLKGSFGGERWGILTIQDRDSVLELPLLLFQSLLVLIGFAFCGIILLSLHAGREILAPVMEISAATKRVSEREWADIKTDSNDELGDLVSAFNDMTRRLRETHDESVRLTREAMVGRLAAMVAHQINTPLTSIKCVLDAIRLRSEDSARELNLVMSQVERIESIVRTLLGFAKLRAASTATTSAVSMVANLTDLFAASFKARGIEFEVVVPSGEDLEVACGSDDLQELLVNLLENARDSFGNAAKNDEEEVRRRWVRVRVSADGRTVTFVVEDNGPGLPPDTARIFDPFVTTKAHGTGLGLAICRRICESAGGSIEAENVPGAGARFRVRLPRVQKTKASS